MKRRKVTQFPWFLVAYFLGFCFGLVSVPAAMAQSENPAQLTQKGWSYWNGTGVEKDYSKAVEFFQKAADQGDANGEYGLGCAYDYGLGVDKDYSRALKWYRKSADQGNSFGEFGLGNCYELGKGVSRDLKKAKNLYELSAKQNNDQGQKALKQLTNPTSEDAQALCDKGLAAQQAGHPDEAFRLYKQSASFGNALAEEELGWCYWNGMGTGKNYSQALEWFKKAAEQGEAGAQYGLGCGYYYGMGAEKDYVEALKWFQKSADQGNGYGRYGVGNCYFNGQGVSKDPARAVQWYQMSADQGNDYGQLGLGRCYQRGAGIGKNMDQARHFFRLAAEQKNEEAKQALKELDHPESIPGGSSSCSAAYPNGMTGTLRTVLNVSYPGNQKTSVHLNNPLDQIAYVQKVLTEKAAANPNGPQFQFIEASQSRSSDLFLGVVLYGQFSNVPEDYGLFGEGDILPVGTGWAVVNGSGLSSESNWLFNVTTHSFTFDQDHQPLNDLLDEAAATLYQYIANGWTCK